VSQFTKSYLLRTAESCGIKVLVVTSTVRSALEQANAMYDKVAARKKDSYFSGGRSVQKVAEKGLKAAAERSATISQMLVEIEKVGFLNVSQHAGVYGLNVVDVAPGGTRFEFRDHDCYHISIMQPEELARLSTVA
jgi:hypothetical protein